MKTSTAATMLMALSLGAFSSTTATAQHEGHSGKSSPSPSTKTSQKAMSNEAMMMTREPHHVLGMAFHHNMATFGKALQEQTVGASSVEVAFARIAVTEMRRSFEQMKVHHQEHMKTMGAPMNTKMRDAMNTRMSDAMRQMETHRTHLNAQLALLEQEVASSTPDAKKVSTLATSVNTHLAAMAKMNHDGMGTKMTMKM